VLTDTRAERLAFDGRRCTGVHVVQGGRPVRIAARREVILAAGAVASPQLLQLSGIGPGALLQSLGVPVLHELRGVGANLQDHLQLRMAFKVQGVRTLNTLANNPLAKLGMALQYLFTRSGPLTMSPSQLGAFAKSDPRQPRPNVEYHVQPLSLEKFGEPLHPFPAFTASVCNLRPTSRGSITARSADPSDAPKIAPNYLSTEEDRQVAVAALRLTRRIVGSSALARFQPREFLPGPDHESDAALARAAGEIGTTIFHPVGTAKMGSAADPSAVVDSALRVHGIGGLRVIDASIMPTITSGNTNAPTLMIAEKGAQLVAGALRQAD
jgi:choline dehydrogenase